MGLHVVETCVEDQLQIRGVWHFGHKLIFVHHLRYKITFLAKTSSDTWRVRVISKKYLWFIQRFDKQFHNHKKVLLAHRVFKILQSKLRFLFDRNLQNYLRHIEGFLAENFAQFFPPLQSLVLVGQVDHLYKLINRYFRWKRSKVPRDPRNKYFCKKLLSDNDKNLTIRFLFCIYITLQPWCWVV